MPFKLSSVNQETKVLHCFLLSVSHAFVHEGLCAKIPKTDMLHGVKWPNNVLEFFAK